MGSLVNQANEAYQTWKSANWPSDVAGWNALTDAQKLTLWATEQQYQLGISDARAIEESFFEARSAAFASFESTKQQEFVALQNLWQAKEDDGPYDVDYVPE